MLAMIMRPATATPTPMPALAPVDRPVEDDDVDAAAAVEDEDDIVAAVVEDVVEDVVVEAVVAVNAVTESLAWNRICTPYALKPSLPVVVAVTVPSPGILVVYTYVTGPAL